MQSLIVRNIQSLVTCDAANTVHHNVDMRVTNGLITEIAKCCDNPDNLYELDATHCIIYPGLVNTHHHFFQAFVRNRVALDWSKLSLIEWLDTIYPIFARVDEDCIYQSSVVSIAELIKNGCTTAFDHQYNYSKNAGSYLVDRQFEAARLFGMRLHAGRGTNTLPMSEGSTIPDLMLETTDAFIADCERLIQAYHQPGSGAMQQVVIAPCQPVNCYTHTFSESAALAKRHNLQLHTHLGEGETSTLLARSGLRSIDWCEKNNFIGDNVWYAHGWEFTEADIDHLSKTHTGISHCPAPVYLVGAEITNVPYMHRKNLRLSMGVDGHASNDNSNLLQCVRLAYLLQSLNAKNLPYGIPEPIDYLKMATVGGAQCLGRSDIGSLAVGMAADFFAMDTHKLEFVGTLQDPSSLPAKVGFAQPSKFTVIAGRIVWKDGEFPNLDEAQLVHEAFEVSKRLL